jgi:serine/threonine protein kinase/Tfp pilus assembly protein PilF
MTSHPWQKAEELFHAALQRKPSERDAFLEKACDGDKALLDEVKSLLGYDGQAQRFIEEPATEAATQEITAAESRLSAGTRLGPYEILGPLGAGGMGEVYRARDPRLKREIAIKVLPEAAASDADRLRRLEREARAASALNHPNIVTIYDIGQHEGTFYIAMEHVEGQTLREALREGPLPAERIIPLAVRIGEALAKAHSAGIVHRDLKPENVMVTSDGYPKILDFGLAKVERLVADADGDSDIATVTKATRAGAILGTAPYMSPEQAAGRAVDHRSDQFAFGSIVYEMATGKRPFKKDTVPQTLAAVIQDDPEPIRKVNYALPVELSAIVERCLAKDPAERYESTGDLANELRTVPKTPSPWRARRRMLRAAAGVLVALLAVASVPQLIGLWEQLSSRAGPASIESIAVLPLRNLSGDPEQEIFVDSMTETLITNLAKIGALKVTSRSSAMRYKGSDKPLAEIARELDVDAVVEGSAMRGGDSVRVMAQLIDPETGQALWAESYERDLENVLLLQGEVARAIAEEVQVALTPEEAGRLAGARTVNPEAHDNFLKGSYHWKKQTPADLDTAQRYFELALEQDPSYAPAYEGLAWVWAVRQQLAVVPTGEAGPKAKEAALQAVELDDGSAGAHAALALVKTLTDWDWAGAERAWRRALELDPNSADAHAFFGYFLAITGRAEEAVSHAERAIELDPFNALFHGLSATVLYFDRRYDDVIAAARTALASQPDMQLARNALQMALYSKGSRDEHLADRREWIAGDAELVAAFEQGLAEGGPEDAHRRLADLLAARLEKSGQAVAPEGFGIMGVAQQYLFAGDPGRTIESLEKAYEVRSPNVLDIGHGPLWDPLRSDPRFQDLVRRLNLPTTSARSDADDVSLASGS